MSLVTIVWGTLGSSRLRESVFREICMGTPMQQDLDGPQIMMGLMIAMA